MPAKGSAFEREVCKQLSLWWTGGTSDSEFWRTSMSGGRATVRARKGKTTTGHAGDVCATGETGAPLMRLVTLELKRGYNKTSNLHNLLDLRPKIDAVQEYERWLWQAREAANRAGTKWWWIIHRRDGRAATITMQQSLWQHLRLEADIVPIVRMTVKARSGKLSGKMTYRTMVTVSMQFDAFLAGIGPDQFRDLLDEGEVE